MPHVPQQCGLASTARAGLQPRQFYAHAGVLPDAVEQWSLTTLKDKLIKIGAKVVRHGRYVTFQMAEVAIPRTLFADILRLIAQLRPPPDPAPA
jgi:hypothetical protein